MYHCHRLLIEELITSQMMVSHLSELSTQELIALERIGQEPWLSMSELSAKCRTAPNTTTGIIDRMVKKKLVRRRHSEKDRRVVMVALTEKAETIYHDYLKLHLEFNEGLLETLTDSEINEYVTLVEKLVRKLEKK